MRERGAQSKGDPPPPQQGTRVTPGTARPPWFRSEMKTSGVEVIYRTAQEAARRLSVKEVLRPAPSPVTEMSSSVGTEVGGRKKARITVSDCGTLLLALLQIQRGFLPPFLRRIETSGGPTHCKHDSAPYPTLSVCLPRKSHDRQAVVRHGFPSFMHVALSALLTSLKSDMP